jgi:hypothetical protein
MTGKGYEIFLAGIVHVTEPSLVNESRAVTGLEAFGK